MNYKIIEFYNKEGEVFYSIIDDKGINTTDMNMSGGKPLLSKIDSLWELAYDKDAQEPYIYTIMPNPKYEYNKEYYREFIEYTSIDGGLQGSYIEADELPEEIKELYKQFISMGKILDEL